MHNNNKIVLYVNFFTICAFLLICIALYNSPLGLLDDQKQILHTKELSFYQLFGLDGLHYFRPVKNLLFYIFMLHKPGTLVYARVLSFIIAFCSYLSVKNLLTKISGSELAASIAGSFWLLAPTMLSSIAWFSCTNLMVMTLSGTSALYFYIKQKEQSEHKRLYFILTSILLFINMICYEGGIALLPMIFAIDFFMFKESFKEKKICIKYLYMGSISVLYISIRYIVFRDHPGFSNANFGSEVTNFQVFFSSAWFTMHHITMWLLPSNSQYIMGNYNWGYIPIYTILLCWLTIALMTIFALMQRNKKPLLSVGISWCLLGFLPMSNLFALRNGPYGDYYLHYASLGIVLIIAYLIKEVQNSSIIKKSIVYIFFGSYMAYLYSTTLLWIPAWQNPIFMIENTLCVFPKQVNMLHKQVNHYMQIGDTARAKEILNTIDTTPKNANEANAYKLLISGKHQEAFDLLVKNAELNPPASRWSLYVMGYLQGECLNNDANAIIFYKKAINYNNICNRICMQAMDKLAVTYERNGKISEAVELWEKLLPITDKPEEIKKKINSATLDYKEMNH